MRDLKATNDLLGDDLFRSCMTLDHLLQANGYLFFRGVLDPAVIQAVRAEYLIALQEAGVVDPESVEPVWNGAGARRVVAAVEGLKARNPWRILGADPTLARILRVIMGGEYTWLPLITYRVSPPLERPALCRDAMCRFVRVHQDGYNNPSLTFVIFWLPLMLIDEEVGGLAIAEGFHKAVLPHDTSGPTKFGISKGVIPDEAWATTTFRSGDMVVMDALTPHTGLTNHSDRFRLSIDFRLSPQCRRPILGRLLAIDSDELSIRTDEGETIDLRINDSTAFPYRRGSALDNGGRIPRAEVADYLTVGQRILATHEAGHAQLVRGFDAGPRG
jgi:hypothetical protein